MSLRVTAFLTVNFVFSAISVLQSSNAEAEQQSVYRCEHAHGLVEYSDRYCGDGARSKRVAVHMVTGLQFTSGGNFSAVELANKKRAKTRGTRKLEGRLSRLADDYQMSRRALEQDIEGLANNSLRIVNERDLTLKLEQLDLIFQQERALLKRKLRNVRRSVQ